MKRDTLEIRFTGPCYRGMSDAVFGRHPNEATVFAACGSFRVDGRQVLTARELRQLTDDDYVGANTSHLEVCPETLLGAVNWTIENGLVLLEAHSHPFDLGPPRFSSVDHQGLREVVPFMLSSLPSRRYAATVWSPGGVDGSLWMKGARVPAALKDLRIFESPVRTIPGSSFCASDGAPAAHSTDPEDDRLTLAIGTSGRRLMTGMTTAVVGLGGLGSWIVEALLSVGVRSFILVDDDVLTRHNLERQPHGFPAQVAQRVKKVSSTKGYIQRRFPGSRVELVPQSLFAREALTTLKKADLIMGCVDTESARLAMAAFSSAYLIPYVDCGTEVNLKGDGPHIAGGRISVCLPGMGCILCSQAIDLAQAHFELSDPAAQDRARAAGYVTGESLADPMISSLNGAVANLAATEVLGLFTGFKRPAQEIHYDARKGGLTAVRYHLDPRCTVCSGLLGLADQSGVVERFSKT